MTRLTCPLVTRTCLNLTPTQGNVNVVLRSHYAHFTETCLIVGMAILPLRRNIIVTTHVVGLHVEHDLNLPLLITA